jgi:hypothetical protein
VAGMPTRALQKLSMESRKDAFYGQVILANVLMPTEVEQSLAPGSSVSTGLVALITPRMLLSRTRPWRPHSWGWA